jgi:hypothetical protein
MEQTSRSTPLFTLSCACAEALFQKESTLHFVLRLR